MKLEYKNVYNNIWTMEMESCLVFCGFQALAFGRSYKITYGQMANNHA